MPSRTAVDANNIPIARIIVAPFTGSVRETEENMQIIG
jgi:hypothetical protein